MMERLLMMFRDNRAPGDIRPGKHAKAPQPKEFKGNKNGVE